MGEAGTGQVKGVLLVHLREYVIEHHGAEVWDALTPRLAVADPGVWQGLILSSSWYPVRVWNHAFSAFLTGRSDARAELRQIAHFVSERDLSTVFRMLLRIAPPEFVLSRLGALWSRYFDMGSMRPTKLGPRHWEAVLDAPVGEDAAPGELTCMGISGWIERALERTGTRNARIVQTHCRFRGAAHCDYDLTW